jgi:hypothetical protein
LPGPGGTWLIAYLGGQPVGCGGLHALDGITAELVEKGLADLAGKRETVEALPVSIGAPRLRELGFELRASFQDPEERLDLLLARDDPGGAHSRYNALVRRLVRFERAAESAH